jgi:hypothetical protein
MSGVTRFWYALAYGCAALLIVGCLQQHTSWLALALFAGAGVIFQILAERSARPHRISNPEAQRPDQKRR